MKRPNSLLVLLAAPLLLTALLAAPAQAQRSQKVFYDSLGQRTDFIAYWAQIVTGRYKMVKARRTYTVARTTDAEYRAELAKTAARIAQPAKIGQPFPAFSLPDLAGQPCSSTELAGKVVVINFWFVGCGPCEMERAALNTLVAHYAATPDVVFLSFSASPPDKLREFLPANPFAYRILPTDRAAVQQQFGAFGYPRSLVIGRDGRIAYDAVGSGVGIRQILQREIERAASR